MCYICALSCLPFTQNIRHIVLLLFHHQSRSHFQVASKLSVVCCVPCQLLIAIFVVPLTLPAAFADIRPAPSIPWLRRRRCYFSFRVLSHFLFCLFCLRLHMILFFLVFIYYRLLCSYWHLHITHSHCFVRSFLSVSCRQIPIRFFLYILHIWVSFFLRIPFVFFFIWTLSFITCLMGNCGATTSTAATNALALMRFVYIYVCFYFVSFIVYIAYSLLLAICRIVAIL